MPLLLISFNGLVMGYMFKLVPFKQMIKGTFLHSIPEVAGLILSSWIGSQINYSILNWELSGLTALLYAPIVLVLLIIAAVIEIKITSRFISEKEIETHPDPPTYKCQFPPLEKMNLDPERLKKIKKVLGNHRNYEYPRMAETFYWYH
jgi:hypothetical protein